MKSKQGALLAAWAIILLSLSFAFAGQEPKDPFIERYLFKGSCDSMRIIGVDNAGVITCYQCVGPDTKDGVKVIGQLNEEAIRQLFASRAMKVKE